MHLQRCYQLELKSVQKLLFSTDKESVILGYSMLRKSPLYQKMKTSSLIFYPLGFESNRKHIVKSLVKKNYQLQLRICNSGYKLTHISELKDQNDFKQMISALLGSHPEKYFRREFLVTDLF